MNVQQEMEVVCILAEILLEVMYADVIGVTDWLLMDTHALVSYATTIYSLEMNHRLIHIFTYSRYSFTEIFIRIFVHLRI